ncbi:TPA: hypothetical protein VOJ02_000564, partial [Streptococcus pyogenes]|nr:hypothetical protein [Streptococcus pyogenes]
MLTSKHHNLNKLVWRYGLTSAAAVLLAFGGGASSVKADSNVLSPKDREAKIKQFKEDLKKYPQTNQSQFWNKAWYGKSYFNEEEYLKSLKEFTEKRLSEIVELIEKGATQGPAGPEGKPGDKGETGARGPRGERGETGLQGP